MARREIQILGEVIQAIVWKITVTEVEIIAATAKIYTCNTLYLNTGKLITIDDIEYRVDSFVVNEYIIVSSVDADDDLPAIDLAEFTLPSPRYYDGTPKRAQIENLNDKKVPGYAEPIIWALMWAEIAPPDDVRFSKIRSTIEGMNIFFLDDCNPKDWNQEDHETEVWGPQENAMWQVMGALRARGDIFDRDINDPARRFHSNFGTYLTNEGYKNTILTGAWSGVQAILNIPYVVDLCTCEKVQVCRPVRFLINYVTEDSFLAGADFNLTLENQDGDVPDFTYDEDTETMVVQTGGDSIDIDVNGIPFYVGVSTNQNLPVINNDANPVGAKVGPNYVIGNTTAHIKNTLGDELITAVLDAEDEGDFVVGGVTATVNGNSITESPAETNKDITITHLNGDPVVITPVTDTATAFEGTIPNVITPETYDVIVDGINIGSLLMDGTTHNITW